jgi:hypothetical protein
MRVALAVLIAAVALPAAQAATSRPRLLVTSERPVVVRGAAFRPAERVVLRVWVEAGVYRKVAVAGAAGGFVARFRVAAGSCGVLAVTARGSKGSKALWKTPPRPCGSAIGPPVPS